MIKFDHIEETNTTYWDHWLHGMTAGSFLFLCSITSIINAFFQNSFLYLKEQRRIAILRMYFDIMSRWNSIQIQQTPERKVQKLEYVLYTEKLKIEHDPNRQINYFTQLQDELERSKDCFVAGASSYIHAFFPNILVDHAAKCAIRIHLKMQFSKDTK